ncbi:hypothetical protein [Streptomyces sp. NPDC059247]|uniref:hypothetical protein n=1 Tax=Streptomyces sp. NPDC059247 TaxID=3346790 RepID=UPI0036A27F50
MTHPQQTLMPRPAGSSPGAEFLGAAWHSTTPARVRMGQHADAVHMPLSAWAAARERLTAQGLLGVVWADGDDVYILTTVERPRGFWRAPARCVGGRWLIMPADPVHARDVRLRWLHRPGNGPLLTRAEDLRAALRGAPPPEAPPRTPVTAPVSSPSSTGIPAGEIDRSGPSPEPFRATATQSQIADLVVLGAGNQQIAATIYMSDSTLNTALRAIRELVHCPPGGSRPVLAHALLRHGHPPPPLTAKASAFTPDEAELNLIRAHAEHSRAADVARAGRRVHRHLPQPHGPPRPQDRRQQHHPPGRDGIRPRASR